MSKCSICNADIESESPSILVMSPYGTPRCVCAECEGEIEVATGGRDIEEISAAIEKISEKVSKNSPDRQIFSAVDEILSSASERARLIKSGEYDFSLDGEEGDFSDIPEDMKESEEDRELDRLDEEKQKTFDKIYNYILGVCIAGVGAYFVWMLVKQFLLK